MQSRWRCNEQEYHQESVPNLALTSCTGLFSKQFGQPCQHKILGTVRNAGSFVRNDFFKPWHLDYLGSLRALFAYDMFKTIRIIGLDNKLILHEIVQPKNSSMPVKQELDAKSRNLKELTKVHSLEQFHHKVDYLHDQSLILLHLPWNEFNNYSLKLSLHHQDHQNHHNRGRERLQ